MNRLAVLAVSVVLLPAVVLAADGVTLVLKDHRFTPVEIAVPAGQKVTVTVRNDDGSVDEFDSSDLKVEEDLTPHSVTTFHVGPLKPGAYRFMGEAHPKTALGVITAK